MLGKDELWRKTNPKKYPDGSADGLLDFYDTRYH